MMTVYQQLSLQIPNKNHNITVIADLNIADGQAVNSFEPLGDHLSNVTPPWPTLLIGIYVSIAGAQTCSIKAWLSKQQCNNKKLIGR